MSNQRPNDASVAAKVATVSAFATVANNATKSRGERGNVVSTAFWITAIFFWFRTPLIYYRYVSQWKEVKELGAIGWVWKLTWPILAAGAPFIAIWFATLGYRLHGKQELVGVAYGLVSYVAILAVLFAADQKFFHARRCDPITDWVGRFFYSLAVSCSILFYLAFTASGQSLTNWVYGGSEVSAAPKSDSPVGMQGSTPQNSPAAPSAKPAPDGQTDAQHNDRPSQNESVPVPASPTSSAKATQDNPASAVTDTVANTQAAIEEEDLKLNSLWKEIKSKAPTNYKQLLTEQRLWLKQRDRCPDQACVLSEYQHRNSELAAINDSL